jgi:hypothetical protein
MIQDLSDEPPTPGAPAVNGNGNRAVIAINSTVNIMPPAPRAARVEPVEVWHRIPGASQDWWKSVLLDGIREQGEKLGMGESELRETAKAFFNGRPRSTSKTSTARN